MKTNFSANTINSEMKSSSEYDLKESESRTILPKPPSASYRDRIYRLFWTLISNKPFLISIVVFLVIALGFIAWNRFSFSNSSVDGSNKTTPILLKDDMIYNRKRCTSSQCYSASHFIIRHLNETADPCTDFYEFVCGVWAEQNIEDIKEIDQFTLASDNFLNDLSDVLEEPHENHDSNVVKNFKKFYMSCTDYLDTESFADKYLYMFLYKEIGEWPILKIKHEKLLNLTTKGTDTDFLTNTRFGIEIFLAKLTVLDMPLIFRFMNDLSKDNYLFMRINTPADFCDFQNLLPKTADESRHFYELVKQIRDDFYGMLLNESIFVLSCHVKTSKYKNFIINVFF